VFPSRKFTKLIITDIFSEFLSVMSPDGSPNSFPSQSPTSSTSLSLVPASNVTTVSSSSLYITENSSVSFVQQWLRLKKFHNFQSKEIRQKNVTFIRDPWTIRTSLRPGSGPWRQYFWMNKKFANFSGQDMLILQRDDFIQIGQEGPGYPNPIAECIRLYNAVRR